MPLNRNFRTFSYQKSSGVHARVRKKKTNDLVKKATEHTERKKAERVDE